MGGFSNDQQQPKRKRKLHKWLPLCLYWIALVQKEWLPRNEKSKCYFSVYNHGNHAQTPSKEQVLTLWLHKHTYHTGMAMYFNPNIKTNPTLVFYTSGCAARTLTEGNRCHNLISHITALGEGGREPGLKKAKVKLHMLTSTNWKVIKELELFSGSSKPAPRNLNKTQRPSKGEHYSNPDGLYNYNTAGSDSVGKPKTNNTCT